MPKVSIIVPVYNAEKTIERCAESLMSQTLHDIEIIFVDDCSTDTSLQKLQSMTADDSRCRIIHNKENCGPALSRQKGLQQATGDYFICSDSDDWAENTWTERLYTQAVKKKADIVWCDFYKNDGNNWNVSKQPPFIASDNIDKYKEITSLMLNKRQGSLCTHMIRHELLQKVTEWPDCRMAEDFALLLQFYIASTVLSYIPLPLYHYDYNEQSLSNVSAASADKRLISQAEGLAKSCSVVERVLKKYSLDKLFRDEIIYRKFFAKRWLLPAIHTAADCRKIWRPLHKDINAKLFTCKYISMSDKLTALLCLLGIYPFLRKIIRRR